MTLYSDSRISRYKSYFIVPIWILDDVGHFYPEIYDLVISKNLLTVKFDILYIEKFIQLRKQIYWLCNWYNELLKANIPVIKSKCFCINNDINVMKNILLEELTDKYKFIRFCNASPKDIISPIFNMFDEPDDIINIFTSSHRTNYMFDNIQHLTHIVIRPVIKIDHEVRCVWHDYILRAVSGPSYYINEDDKLIIKLLVDKFFQQHGCNIVFNSAIIDIGITQDDVYIIEINSFGVDMLSIIGHFDWENDFMVLYNSDTPVYRFKQEFEW